MGHELDGFYWNYRGRDGPLVHNSVGVVWVLFEEVDAAVEGYLPK